MKNSSKTIHQHPFLAAIICAVAAILIVLIASISVSADGNPTSCADKINIDKCEAAVKKCDSASPDRKDDCIRAAVAPFHAVIDACRAKVRPQACDTAVAKDCDKITVPDRKDDCIKNRAKDFKNAPTNSASTGTTGKESVFATGNKNFQCGNTEDAVETKFNLGCMGESAPSGTPPINDMVYSLIRLMSAGVGIIVVISIIAAGIQYSSSEGNPEATQAAKSRIQNSLIGLLIYIFAFSFVQYIVPGGVFAGSMVVPTQPYIESIIGLI